MPISNASRDTVSWGRNKKKALKKCPAWSPQEKSGEVIMLKTGWKIVLECTHYVSTCCSLQSRMRSIMEVSLRKPSFWNHFQNFFRHLYPAQFEKVPPNRSVTLQLSPPHPQIVPKALHLLSKSATMDLYAQVPVLIFNSSWYCLK